METFGVWGLKFPRAICVTLSKFPFSLIFKLRLMSQVSPGMPMGRKSRASLAKYPAVEIQVPWTASIVIFGGYRKQAQGMKSREKKGKNPREKMKKTDVCDFQ